MSPQGESLGEAEQQALQLLEPALRNHALVTENAFNLIGETLSCAPEILLRDLSQSRKAATSLLVRLSNDLRSAALLALRGYPVQAASLVASMYEAAFCIAYIGADNAIAQQWIDHADPTQPFRKVLTLTKNALHRLGVENTDEETRNFYKRRFLGSCYTIFVHNNNFMRYVLEGRPMGEADRTGTS